ncbi:MAG TPA: hypothetical protein VD978_11465 [Azospirillum sp.]|nr:hypothetical protein [Azospirillum sp.]
MDALNDPFLQSSVLPLVLALVAVGVLRLAGGPDIGRRLAVAGIVLTFLGVFAFVVGVPAFPPPSSMGRLFWCAVAGLAVGIVADGAGLKGAKASVLIAAWLAGSLLWLTLPALSSPSAALVAVPVLAAGGWVAFGRLPAGKDGPATSSAVLLALSLTVGGTALAGSSASLAQTALAMAAATGGFLLWNWPVERHAWGVSGRVAFGIPVLLAAALAFFTQARVEVLLLALPVVFVDRLRARLPVPDTAVGRALATAAITVLAVVPAMIAVGTAYVLSAAGSSASGY